MLIHIEHSFDLSTAGIKKSGLLEDKIVKVGLGHRTDDSLLDLIFFVDEGEVAVALECSLLYELFTSTMANTECVHTLVYIALLAD